ncbi:hypothetical protein NPIL_192331, partial [Nephila pilipes]
SLGKGLKYDLIELPQELGENVSPDTEVENVRIIIVGNENYEEEFVILMMERITTRIGKKFKERNLILENLRAKLRRDRCEQATTLQ